MIDHYRESIGGLFFPLAVLVFISFLFGYVVGCISIRGEITSSIRDGGWYLYDDVKIHGEVINNKPLKNKEEK